MQDGKDDGPPLRQTLSDQQSLIHCSGGSDSSTVVAARESNAVQALSVLLERMTSRWQNTNIPVKNMCMGCFPGVWRVDEKPIG